MEETLSDAQQKHTYGKIGLALISIQIPLWLIFWIISGEWVYGWNYINLLGDNSPITAFLFYGVYIAFPILGLIMLCVQKNKTKLHKWGLFISIMESGGLIVLGILVIVALSALGG